MKISQKGVIILGMIGLIYVIVTIIKVIIPADTPFHVFVRLFALWGFIALSIATIMTPFIREITKSLGKPFLKIHHIFGLSGLTLATLHPIIFAIEKMDITVFIPNFESWIKFWELAGRPALIVLYLAVIGVLLRKKVKNWRWIHALMYLVLFMAYIHGILIGTDFQNWIIVLIFSLLMAASIFALVMKRYLIYQRTKKRKQRIKKTSS